LPLTITAAGNTSNSLRQFPDHTCRRVGRFLIFVMLRSHLYPSVPDLAPAVERYNWGVNWPKSVFPIAVVELFETRWLPSCLAARWEANFIAISL